MNSASKIPLHLTVILIILLGAYAWVYKMKPRSLPKMSGDENFQLIYSHQEENDSDKDYRIALSIKARNLTPTDVTVYYIAREDLLAKQANLQKSDFKSVRMSQAAPQNYFAATLPPLPRAQKYYFFIEALDNAGNARSLPENAVTGKNFLRVTFKMNPNQVGLIIHVFLMIATLFFLIHAFYYAFNYLWNKEDWSIGKTFSNVLWGTIVFFVSGFPLGMWIAYEKYGVAWGGIPFGWDITDNKTQITFVYWLVVIILARTMLFKKGMTGAKAFAWLIMLGIVITAVVFGVVPHSL